MSKINNCACEQHFHLAIYICKLCDQVICPKKVLQNLYTKNYYCPNCILDIALVKQKRTITTKRKLRWYIKVQDLEKRIEELEIIVNDLVKFQTLLLHSLNYLGKDEEKFKNNIKRLK